MGQKHLSSICTCIASYTLTASFTIESNADRNVDIIAIQDITCVDTSVRRTQEVIATRGITMIQSDASSISITASGMSSYNHVSIITSGNSTIRYCDRSSGIA